MVKKEKPKTKKIVVVYALMVVLLLFGVAGYYYKNQWKLGVRTGLVGDSVCGNIPGEDAQDLCCERAHEGDVVVQCVGNWNYISGISGCRFLCEGQLPVCPDDSKICDDGSSVIREGIDCEFEECFFEED